MQFIEGPKSKRVCGREFLSKGSRFECGLKHNDGPAHINVRAEFDSNGDRFTWKPQTV